MPNPLFSVVIPLFNRWELTEACLKSLAEQTAGLPFEVVTVDNGSTDATPEALPTLGRELFGDLFRPLRFEENRNFAAGCNAGAAAATAPLLFFLNNDTLLTPGWAPPLLRALAGDPDLGAAGPLLLYPNSNRVQHMGVTMSMLRLVHLYAQFPAEHPAVTRPRLLQAITGAALLLPAALFRDCGGFFPEYRNGFEDLELCRNIRLRNKRLAVVPHSRVIHLESQSAGRNRYDQSNSRLFTERCGADYHPDLHQHAALDGFVSRLEPDLSLLLTLAPERAAALAPLLTEPERALPALLAEPLWEEAYEPLIAFLQAQSKPAEALDLRLLHVEFFPSPAAYLSLAKAATRVRQPQLAEQAVGIMNAQTKRAKDTPRLTAQAQNLAAAARERGDQALEALLDEWMKGNRD